MNMKAIKKIICLITSIVLVATIGFCYGEMNVVTANDGVSNPRITDKEVTWDCIYFGNYPQSSDGSGGFKVEPIKWRVLSVNGDDAFIMAENILDCKKYDTNNKYPYGRTWETCTLRSWLNGYAAKDNKEGTDYTSSNFINTAFNSDERAAIYTTTVINDDNPIVGTDGGNDTQDKVYLLSIAEASNVAYGFDSVIYNETRTRESKATDYAVSQGCWTAPLEEYASNGLWWLRSPGEYNSIASFIAGDGWGSTLDGDYLDEDRYGVRPVLHLNLLSNKWSSAGTVSADALQSETTTKTQDTTKTKPNVKLSKPVIKKITTKKKSLKVTWKVSSGVTGYRLQYSLKKNFKKAKTVAIKKASTHTKTIKKLKKKKKYYIRLKSYKIVGGTIYLSGWSKAASKKTK